MISVEVVMQQLFDIRREIDLADSPLLYYRSNWVYCRSRWRSQFLSSRHSIWHGCESDRHLLHNQSSSLFDEYQDKQLGTILLQQLQQFHYHHLHDHSERGNSRYLEPSE